MNKALWTNPEHIDPELVSIVEQHDEGQARTDLAKRTAPELRGVLLYLVLRNHNREPTLGPYVRALLTARDGERAETNLKLDRWVFVVAFVTLVVTLWAIFRK
jgi:hypothetical protein